MRLANLVPSISPALVAHLDTIGIRTETDLLFSAAPREIFTRLPAGTFRCLEELEEAINIVTELCAAPGVSCLELLHLETQALEKCKDLISGNENIDRLLHGLGQRKLIQLSGDKGSGKSIFALNLVLNHLACYEHSRVAWIDTAGDFPLQVAIDILNEKQIASRILDRLQVSLAFDLDAAQAGLDELFKSGSTSPLLLVIDSITPLLAPLLSAVSAHGHALMTDLMRHLQYLAQTFGTTVLLLNSTARKGMDTLERKPALGPSFALLTDTTLWLQSRRENQSNDLLHSIQILSSRSKALGEIVAFCMNSNVIRPG